MYQLVCPNPPAADNSCAAGWIVTEVSPAMSQADFESVIGAVALLFATAAIFKMILRKFNL